MKALESRENNVVNAHDDEESSEEQPMQIQSNTARREREREMMF